MFNKIVVGLLVAALVLVGSAGVVLADDEDPPVECPFGAECPMGPGGGFGGGFGGGRRSEPGAELEIIAETLGMEADALLEALAEGQSVAELAEAQGVDLDTVIDAVVAYRMERMAEMLRERFSSPGGFGRGRGRGPGGGMGRGPGGGMGQGANLPLVAEALGMEVEDLAEALRDGQTIAEVAEAQGVTPEALVETVIAPRVERIEQAVEDGRLTEEQAEEMIARMTEQMLECFESGDCGMGRGPGGGMGHGRGRGRGRGMWGDDAPPPPPDDSSN